MTKTEAIDIIYKFFDNADYSVDEPFVLTFEFMAAREKVGEEVTTLIYEKLKGQK